MPKLLLLLGIFFLCPGINSSAQKKYTISGYVKDKDTKEVMIGAVVSVPAKQTGKATNEYGFFSLDFEKDSITLIIEYTGYQTFQKTLFLDKDIMLDLEISTGPDQMQEVVIEADHLKHRVTSTQMSLLSITPKEAREIPVIFGEVDLLKTLQLKPGIQSGGEGSSGLYVRGGGYDQNLVLLDEALVYNASHLFSLFSIFNPDAVKNIDLYKGGFPPQYGGRLSSVIDIKLNEGNKDKYVVKGGLGLIAARLTLEGPIQKGKSSFIISARRTYIEPFTRAVNHANRNNKNYDAIPDYYFYDLNAKLNFELGKKDKLFFSGYFGRDVFSFGKSNFDFDFKWGNITSTMRWNHVFSSKLFANTSIIYSDYKYATQNQAQDFSFKLGSTINDFSAKTDFYYSANNKHTIRFGGILTDHLFDIGRVQAGTQDESLVASQGTKLQATEGGVYVNDEFDAGSRWKFNTGIRLTGFANHGKFYSGIEPRLSGRYLLNQSVSFKASYARMYQYLHLVSNSGASLPNDIWYPSNNSIKPQLSDQVAGGVNILLFDNKYHISNELYYKKMRRQIDFRDGAKIFSAPNLDQEFVIGKGWAYGNEFFIEKKEGKIHGWIGYTLSWTWRQFPQINNGEKFPARYDRRHDISVVVIYKMSDRLSISGTWVFGNGNAVTLPVGRVLSQDIPGASPKVVPEYGNRNSFRMAPYNRMDLGAVWKLKPKRGEADLTFSIYNVYNRRNPYFIYYDEVKDGSGNVTGFKAKQVSLFPIIPSVTYNFKF